MHPTEHFLALLNKYTSGTLTAVEEVQFVELLYTGKYRDWLDMDVREKLQNDYEDHELFSLSEERANKLIQSILRGQQTQQLIRPLTADLQSAVINPSQDSIPVTADLQSADARPVHRIHLLKTAWFRYAAAVIIILGISAYLWNIQQKEKPSVTQTNPVPVQNDVAPGGNRATLTLADGRKIILDNTSNGRIAKENRANVIKTADGRIEYEATTSNVNTVSYNTMTTPRGGQYELRLPDGSQVWLNAESSITYPTAFAGKERKVSITGEAYFEVTHNAKQPFKVETGTQTIEVLGTKFNINAYNEEPTINTTLLEGSVRLTSHPSPLTSALTLKPGQQGQLKDQKLVLAKDPDIDQVMAWKNGLFAFNDASMQEVMVQLARWYNMEVVYEGPVTKREFTGKIGRQLTLAQVLKGLSATKINYRIEKNNRIVILP
jgi:transmembrane sensor